MATASIYLVKFFVFVLDCDCIVRTLGLLDFEKTNATINTAVYSWSGSVHLLIAPANSHFASRLIEVTLALAVLPAIVVLPRNLYLLTHTHHYVVPC